MATKIEKKQKHGYTEIPKDGRIPCKVLNLEVPGADIEACINGVTFQIQHGQVVNLHPSQIEVLNNATIETKEFEELPQGGWAEKDVHIPRFMVQPQMDELKAAIPELNKSAEMEAGRS